MDVQMRLHRSQVISQTSFDGVQEFWEVPRILGTPESHADPQIQWPPRSALLVSDGDVPLDPLPEYRGARFGRVHRQRGELGFADARDQVGAPEALREDFGYLAQGTLGGAGAEGVAQRHQILEEDANKNHGVVRGACFLHRPGTEREQTVSDVQT